MNYLKLFLNVYAVVFTALLLINLFGTFLITMVNFKSKKETNLNISLPADLKTAILISLYIVSILSWFIK